MQVMPPLYRARTLEDPLIRLDLLEQPKAPLQITACLLRHKGWLRGSGVGTVGPASRIRYKNRKGNRQRVEAQRQDSDEK